MGLEASLLVTVNGKTHDLRGIDELSYDDVVRVAGKQAVGLPEYTVTFRHGHPDKPEGTLVFGESVRLKDGMVFNVARTDNA